MTFGVGVLMAALAGCGPSDPQPRAEPPSSTTSVAPVSTTVSLAPTSTPDDVLCGTELPLFPKVSLLRELVVDTEGSPGAAADADPKDSLTNQVIRHWEGLDGISIEMRWPAGPGPTVESSVVVTQLVDTGSPAPCDVVRVSGYGREDALSDFFPVFVDSLDGADAKQAFEAEQAEQVTQANATEPGACADPVLSDLDDNANPDPEQVRELLRRYATDRSKGTGYEACFTIAGLRELDAGIAVDGIPDIVRPSVTFDLTAEALATYLDTDPLRVLRESLSVVAIPAGESYQLLFGGVTTGPDSNVGEEEAIAFIDEFLILLADRNYESAAGYLINEGVADDVLAAMPTFEDEPAEALRRYCRTASCDATYKINDTIEFDANTRTIDVTFFTKDDTIEYPMVVGVFEGKLVVQTPPPAS